MGKGDCSVEQGQTLRAGGASAQLFNSAYKDNMQAATRSGADSFAGAQGGHSASRSLKQGDCNTGHAHSINPRTDLNKTVNNPYEPDTHFTNPYKKSGDYETPSCRNQKGGASDLNPFQSGQSGADSSGNCLADQSNKQLKPGGDGEGNYLEFRMDGLYF